MSDHVFISYDKDDRPYVDRLARHLELHGVDVWFDREIELGAQWATAIQERIDTCAAFIVVMTPAADQSRWVEREIARAESMDKPIHPLLLQGQPFFRLSDLQYADVTDGEMPSDELLAHLPSGPVLAAMKIRELRGTKQAYFEASALPLLSRKDRGEWVVALQQELERVGLDIGVGGADGFFGPDTEHALRSFQSRENLDVDSVVGPETWLRLLVS